MTSKKEQYIVQLDRDRQINNALKILHLHELIYKFTIILLI